MDPLTTSSVIASLIFGVGGIVVGCISLVSARRANVLAGRANEIAEAANSTADRSVAQVEAADARALERHVVEWAMGWDARHLFWVRNDGHDTSRATFIRVTVDGVPESVTQELDVPPHQVVRLQFDGVLTSWDAEDEARANHKPVETYDGIVIVHGAFRPATHAVRVQIWWRTDLGVPCDFEHAYSSVLAVTDP